MNPRLEWAVPLAAGLIAGLALWGLAGSGSDGGHGGAEGSHPEGASTTAEPPQPILLPFDGSVGAPGEDTTFLLLAPLGRAAAEARVNRSAAGGDAGFPDQTAWQGDKVALYTAPNLFAGCQDSDGDGQAICSDPMWVFGDWPLPKARALPDGDAGPRLLHGGHNATRVTAYVVDEAGLLLASNANDTARFRQHGDFVRLPSTAWYLGGNATAPNGTSALPGFAKPLVDRVRPQLDGLPVGGVASVRSNAYAALYGSLFVTVRVESLVHAP